MPIRQSRAALAALVAMLVLGACTTAFDPAGPCTADGSRPGAYPDLEQLVPATFEDRPADRVDSGRNCTERALGTLWTDGLREIRFAGGLWELGSESGATLAVFSADGLTPERLADFYEAGARSAPDIADIEESDLTIDGLPARRLDLDNDGYRQSVVIWPHPAASVRAVLVSSAARDVPDRAAHDARVDEAIDAFRAAGDADR
jgi:hypothetical protein